METSPEDYKTFLRQWQLYSGGSLLRAPGTQDVMHQKHHSDGGHEVLRHAGTQKGAATYEDYISGLNQVHHLPAADGVAVHICQRAACLQVKPAQPPTRRACHQAVCAAALSRRDTCVCAVRPRVHSLRCGCRQRRAVAASRGAGITMSQPLVACRRLKSRGQRDAAGLLHLSTASAQGRGFFPCNKVHQPHLWRRLLSWKDDPLDLPRRQSQTG